jgi:hypothetical protein
VRLGDVGGVLDVGRLERAAHDRQRGAQLMAHIAHEAALLGEALLDPLQHAVEVLGERGDVVPARGRDAMLEIGDGDLLGGAAEILQRPQQTPRDDIAAPAAQQQRQHRQAREDRDALPQLTPLRTDVAGDDEHSLRVIARDRDRGDEHAQIPAVDLHRHDHGAPGHLGVQELGADQLGLLLHRRGLGRGHVVGDPGHQREVLLARLVAGLLVDERDHRLVVRRSGGVRRMQQQAVDRGVGRAAVGLSGARDQGELAVLLPELGIDPLVQGTELRGEGEHARDGEAPGDEREEGREHPGAHRPAGGSAGGAAGARGAAGSAAGGAAGARPTAIARGVRVARRFRGAGGAGAVLGGLVRRHVLLPAAGPWPGPGAGR